MTTLFQLAAPAWLSTLAAASLYAALFAIIVLALQPLLRRHIPARYRLALWLVVLIRFLPLPLPESRLSVFNWLPHSTAPTIATPIPVPVLTPTFTPITQDLPPATLAPLPKPAPTKAPIPQPAPPLPLLPIAYAAGVLFLLARLTRAMRTLRRTLRAATPILDPNLIDLLRSVQTQLRSKTPLPLFSTDALSTPALVGLFRPRLLLPAHLLASLSPADFRAIFLHEVAHLRRKDIAFNYFLAALACLHWFNPVLWLILPRIKADRELACDELVLRHTPDRAAYGHTLLKLFQLTAPTSPSTPALAVGILDTDHKSFFTRRIRMIAAFKKSPSWLTIPVVAALAVIGACALTNAQSTPAPAAAHATPGPDGFFHGFYEPTNLPAAQLARMIVPSIQSGIVGVSAEDNKVAVFAKSTADLDKAMIALAQFDTAPAVTIPGPVNGANAQTLARLDLLLKEFNFDNIPLNVALEKLRDASHCNIYINWRALEGAGIPADVKVSARLNNVPVRKVLHTLLDDAGAGRIDFLVEDGVITISTADDLDRIARRMPTPVVSKTEVPATVTITGYELSRQADADLAATQKELQELSQRLVDLSKSGAAAAIDAPARALQEKITTLTKSLQETMAARRAAEPTATITPAPAPQRRMQIYDVHALLDADLQASVLSAEQQAALKDLVAMLHSHIDPTTTLDSFNGMLVVTAPEKTHDEIRSILDQLQDAHARRAAELRDRAKKP